MKITLIGDSLSASPAGSPGGVLASLLEQDGHVVTVDAKVGRSLSQLSTARLRELARGQDIVLVWLGTNDLGSEDTRIASKILGISGALSLSPDMEGPAVVGVSPPTFNDDARGAGDVDMEERSLALLPTFEEAWGPAHFLDARILSSDVVGPTLRARDGIHFTPRGAAILGRRLHDAISGSAESRTGSGRGFLLLGGLALAATIALLLLRR